MSHRGEGVLDGQDVWVVGGLQASVNSWVQDAYQGQPAGRWRVMRRAERAIRAGTAMSLRRTVPVVAFVVNEAETGTTRAS